MTNSQNVNIKLLSILKESGISYEEIIFDQQPSREEALALRAKRKAMGAKSILFKDKKDFRVFTLALNMEVDSNKVRKILGSNKLRFATHEELMEHCGVVKGALPPIVKNVYPFSHYIDKSIYDHEVLAFNAGVLGHTIILKRDDYLKLIDAEVCEFSKS